MSVLILANVTISRLEGTVAQIKHSEVQSGDKRLSLLRCRRLNGWRRQQIQLTRVICCLEVMSPTVHCYLLAGQAKFKEKVSSETSDNVFKIAPKSYGNFEVCPFSYKKRVFSQNSSVIVIYYLHQTKTRTVKTITIIYNYCYN